MRVRRKDGREEEFVSEKIVVAVVKAGGKAEIGRAIAKEVERALSSNTTVTTEQIRTEVLNRLKSRDSKTYNSWVAYDKENK
jgi:transcriptional regulator NrdR family protein